MSKYIDADKLRAEIERRFWDYGTPLHDDVITAKVDEVLSLIDSLQQEQESVAEQFAKIVRANLSEIDEKAQQEFEQLYFKITGNKMYGGYND